MFPVFESIKVLDGVVMHLDYHIARMQSTCKKLWGETKAIEPCVQEILNNKQNGLRLLVNIIDNSELLVSY